MFRSIMKFLCLTYFSVAVPLTAAWSPPEHVWHQTTLNPQVAVDPDGNATAVWIQRNIFTFQNLICASTRPFEGTWQLTIDTISLTDVATLESFPQIVVDSKGNATAAWITNANIVQAATKPFGNTWLPSVNVGQATLGTVVSLAVDSAGNVTAVWEGIPTGEGHFVQACTKPVSGNWGPQVNISPDLADSTFNPQIAVNASGDAMAVWSGRTNALGSVWTIQSAFMPFGENWEVPIIISDNNASAFSFQQVALDSNSNATAIWRDAAFIIQSSFKTRDGDWQPLLPVSSTPSEQVMPQIALDSAGNATAIWENLVGGINVVLSATKPFEGSWETQENISQQDVALVTPQIAIDPAGNATVAFAGFTVPAIFSTNKPFEGSWQPPVLISVVLPDSNANFPDLAVDPAGNPTVVWSGKSSLFFGEAIISATNLIPSAVTSLNQNAGAAAGGNTVIITGTNFLDATQVLFGTTEASSFTVVSSRTIAVSVPPGTPGTVDITVVTSLGATAVTHNDQYTYLPPPLPPSLFNGAVKKKKHAHKHPYHLRATWKASPSVQFYRVYKGSNVVDVVREKSKLLFKAHLLQKSSTDKFSVTAVDAYSVESSHTPLTVKD